MTMSRKVYVETADILRGVANVTDASAERQATVFQIARRLASMFAEDNPRFDRDKFLTAAGF